MERIRGGWVNVPEHLKCKTDLKEMGLKPTGEAKAEVWNGHIWVKLYNISETAPCKPATEKQLAAVEKARTAQLAARTCSRCEGIISRKERLLQGICDYCRESLFIEEISKNAFKLLRNWVDNKSKYLILDTEATGLDYDSEIVDIAVIDLDENVLFESLVKPVCPIPEEATAIHGITNEMVENAPSWPEVWVHIQKILSVDKTILTYNADYDFQMIRSNCERHNQSYTLLKNFCVMQTYAEYVGSYSRYHRDFTWISLMDAAYDQDIRMLGIGSHRAKADCIVCARLIHRVAKRGVEKELAKKCTVLSFKKDGVSAR
ncbi:exonuclease domain-containing protein [Paenibacillus allorhizosphaerae]|uniref:3'-5' exonuclease DinG n=1 Tax=Paenibacillus allorhizosphaerae TaxID=2849866 RepID=A0ABN7TQN8_9BACL|nr:3'-5' exonuclease [Paenibacillus allorhizosphaerae]CAG7651641.1 3'-5' exonuclease DinG [Paenibacillus allorhizosphaerae]